MKSFIVILFSVLCIFARSVYDTSTVTLIYGVSHEPLTPTDTVTTKMYYKSGDKIYIKPLSGGELWAAWVKEIRK